MFREQKDRFLEKAQAESAFAPLEDVEGYLAQFVAKRPDLFGSIDDHAVRILAFFSCLCFPFVRSFVGLLSFIVIRCSAASMGVRPFPCQISAS